MPTRGNYTKKLQDLYQDVYKMGLTVGENIRDLGKLLDGIEQETVSKVKARENEINNFEIAIEDSFMALIATETPVAGDLRKIVASLKMISQLERMGDYAMHIAKSLKKTDAVKLRKFEKHFKTMVETSAVMLDETLTAFLTNDAELARTAAKRDDVVDNEHEAAISKLYKNTEVQKNPKDFARILFIGRHLERLADHCTNICEWIVFAVKSTHVELNEQA